MTVEELSDRIDTIENRLEHALQKLSDRIEGVCTELIPQPPGLQTDLLKCSRATREWVAALGNEIARLRGDF